MSTDMRSPKPVLRLGIFAKLIAASGLSALLLGALIIYLLVEIGRTEVLINRVRAHQDDLLGQVVAYNQAAKDFGDMRYWLTDLAVSLLNESENSADEAQGRLVAFAERIKADDAELAASIGEQVERFHELAIRAVDAYVEDNRVLGNSLLAEARMISLAVDNTLSERAAALNSEAQASTQALSQNTATLRMQAVIGLILVSTLALAAAGWLARLITRPIKQAVTLAEAIAAGNLNVAVVAGGSDETGLLLRALSGMRDRLRELLTSISTQAEDGARIKQALGQASTSLTIVDADLQVIYANAAALRMFEQGPATLRTLAGNVLAGGDVTRLHPAPEAFAKRLRALATPDNEECHLHERIFRIAATPVFADDGHRSGTVLEWVDYTVQLRIEEQIQGLVQGAGEGRLELRVDTSGMTAFYGQLCQGMNDLVALSERVVDDLVLALSRLAAGDLTARIEQDYHGRYLQLKQLLNETMEHLSGVIGETKHAAASVRTGAAEIAQGNMSLSTRVEQQASALEETVSRIGEMTNMVQANADSARDMSKLAQQAETLAREGDHVAHAMKEAMEGIRASSRTITEITTLMDSIAFQTNLLALNAAVEAARAGDHGRGFAVVSSEVRQLAQRSGASAKDIGSLIRESDTRIHAGMDLTGRMAAHLESIVQSIRSVTAASNTIAEASAEQADRIRSINGAVSEMDSMNQQNAALVEEAASASASLELQAQRLDELAGFFRI